MSFHFNYDVIVLIMTSLNLRLGPESHLFGPCIGPCIGPWISSYFWTLHWTLNLILFWTLHWTLNLILFWTLHWTLNLISFGPCIGPWISSHLDPDSPLSITVLRKWVSHYANFIFNFQPIGAFISLISTSHPIGVFPPSTPISLHLLPVKESNLNFHQSDFSFQPPSQSEFSHPAPLFHSTHYPLKMPLKDAP
jgi:hypothetical protein